MYVGTEVGDVVGVELNLDPRATKRLALLKDGGRRLPLALGFQATYSSNF